MLRKKTTPFIVALILLLLFYVLLSNHEKNKSTPSPGHVHKSTGSTKQKTVHPESQLKAQPPIQKVSGTVAPSPNTGETSGNGQLKPPGRSDQEGETPSQGSNIPSWSSMIPSLNQPFLSQTPLQIPLAGSKNANGENKNAIQMTSSLGVDDYGIPYTGSMRLTGQTDIKNILKGQDDFSFSLTSSFGYNSVALMYSIPVGTYRTRFFAGYSAYNYIVGDGWSPIMAHINSSALKTLGASGYGQDISAGLSQPIIKNKHTDLRVKLQFDEYILSDTYDQTAGVVNARNLTSETLSIPLTWQNDVDQMVMNASYEYYTMDKVSAANTANPFYNAPDNAGIWRIFVANTSKLPGDNNSLYVYFNGMFSSGILDPTQELALGGYASVRGFATATLFGNDGFTATAELRHVLADSVAGGRILLRTFFDMGSLSLGNNTNYLTLLSPGVGSSWYGPKNWAVSFDLGVPVGNVPSIVGSYYPIQAWFSVEKNF